MKAKILLIIQNLHDEYIRRKLQKPCNSLTTHIPVYIIFGNLTLSDVWVMIADTSEKMPQKITAKGDFVMLFILSLLKGWIRWFFYVYTNKTLSLL